MSWPLSQDYNEAIQSPGRNFTDHDLKSGKTILNVLGLPIPFSGNFADVYEVDDANGNRWAVKCFTRETPNLRERYGEISKHLRLAKLRFTIDFTWLEQGIRVGGKWYPVLKMQWVEGLTLNQFVAQSLDKPAMLDALLQLWARMGRHLRASGAAHADLQHGNVLLVPGANAHALSLKLIDYDGMFVPSLAGRPSGEVGHPSYQHPKRGTEGTYSPEVDRFPLLLVATALTALKVKGRALWEKYDNGDNMLFKEDDLKAPTRSPLFAELLKSGDAKTVGLTEQLLESLRGGVASAPLLEEVLPELRSTRPARSASVVPAESTGPQPSEPREEVWNEDLSPPGRSPAREAANRGVPLAAWLGGIAALVVLVGAVGAFVLINAGSGDTAATNRPIAENRTRSERAATAPTRRADPVPATRSSTTNSTTPATRPDPVTTDREPLPSTQREPSSTGKEEPKPRPVVKPVIPLPDLPPKEPKPGVKMRPTSPPVPDAEDIAAADRTVRDIYRPRIEMARSPEELGKLVTLLIKDGIGTPDKPATRFALFRLARDLPAGMGNFRLSFRAAAEMAKHFDISFARAKADSVEAVCRMSAPPGRARVASIALSVADDAEEAEDYETAARLARAAQTVMTGVNSTLITAALARVKEADALRKAYERVSEDARILELEPDDPGANLAMGKFHALSRGDWDRALPFLARGRDARWKELAQQDLVTAADGSAMRKLADEYAALAEKESDLARTNLLFRAHYWYRQAELKLMGIDRQALTKSTNDLEKRLPSARPVILHARYGANNSWGDLTEQFRTFVVQAPNQKLVFKRANLDMGIPDPADGQHKSLVVVYRYRGGIHVSITGDLDTGYIPAAPGTPTAEVGRPTAGQELVVFAARYGNENRYADGTAKAQTVVTGAILATNPEQLEFRDPFFGRHKGLIIVYRDNGRVRLSTTGETIAVRLGADRGQP